MNSTPRATRSLHLIGAASLAIVFAASGCSWFGHKTDYQASKEANPLEIPPDLDHPDNSAATSMPPVGSTSLPSSTSDGHLPVPASEAYPKIAEMLANTPGVVVNGRAEALSSYDVSYKGESFLLRVLDSNGGSRLVALSADGRMLNNGPAAELMSAIKSKF